MPPKAAVRIKEAQPFGWASFIRGDWRNFKREVQLYAAVFLHGPQPHILRIGAIMRQTA